MNIRQKLELKEEYEFSNEERADLCAKWELSLIDPKNHALPAELEDKVLRAHEERVKINKRLNHVNVVLEQQNLLDLCKVKNMANDIKNQLDEVSPLESMLIDQMSAIHRASMLLLRGIYEDDDFDFDMGEKFINLSNKLMKTYQNGLQTLNHVKNSGKQTIVVKHQNVQVNGGQAIVGTEINAPNLMGGGE